MDNFERLMTWMREHGASFQGIEIRHIGRGERGAFAIRDLKPREILWDIPEKLIITRDRAHDSAIGQQAMNAATSLESGDSVYAAYLLDEVYNPSSFWQPFFDGLPRAFPHIPLFYTDAELDWLTGSFLRTAVKEVRDAYSTDYELLKEHVPEFRRFSLEEFLWARVTLATRTFACEVKGSRLDCLVPLMDMMNHDRHFNVFWQCAPDRPHLRAGPPEPIPAGSELLVSYGIKSNRRYLLVYGFVMAGDDMDEAAIEVGVPDDVPAATPKRMLLLGKDEASRFRRFFLSQPMPDRDNTLTCETLAFMRLAQASEAEFATMLKDHARPAEIGPTSAANEARALRMLEAACVKALAQFPTSIEEDEALLAGELSYSARNCVVVRRGEKRILHWFIGYAREVARILESNPTAFEQIRPQLIGA